MQLHFQGKNRELSLTYTKMQDKIIMITFHPLKKGKKKIEFKQEGGPEVPGRTREKFPADDLVMKTA